MDVGGEMACLVKKAKKPHPILGTLLKGFTVTIGFELSD